MKRKWIWVLCLCGLLAAAATACGKTTSDVPVAQNEEAVDALQQELGEESDIEPAEELDSYDDSRITEAYSIEKEMTYDPGYEYEYTEQFSFHLPQLTDVTEDAKSINQEIIDTYGAYAESIEGTEENCDSPINQMSYQTAWNDSLLSLVIEADYMYDDYREYMIFNYDFKEGKRLTNAEVVALSGMSETAYISRLRREAVAETDSTFDSMSQMNDGVTEEMTQSWYTESLNLRGQTISDQYLSMDTPVYFNEEGKLVACARIGIMAGGGWYYKDLVIDSDTAADAPLEDNYMDAVYTSYQNGILSVRIEETDWAKETFIGTNLEFGKEYTVDGAYADYTDLTSIGLGTGQYPYIVLLTKDGCLAYIDVGECVNADYFAITEPMYHAETINEFNDDSIIDIRDELENAVMNRYLAFNQDLLRLEGDEGFKTPDGSEDVEYYIGFDAGSGTFLYQKYTADGTEALNMSGALTYLGMNEKGLIFSYLLTDQDGEMIDEADWKRGTFIKVIQTDEDYDYDKLTILPLSGDDLFDAGNQGEMEFTRTYG